MENTIVTNGRVKNIVEELESHKDVSKVLMLCLAGSHAYGTATPTSDTDIRGIIVARPGVIRAPFRTLREMGIEGEEDGKVYELNNFMELFCSIDYHIIEATCSGSGCEKVGPVNYGGTNEYQYYCGGSPRCCP